MSLSVAIGFALVGYWPILPFAGLELLALGVALRWSLREGQRRELIRIDESHITVSKSARGQVNEYRFVRPWTRVELEKARTATWPRRLLLTSKGRTIEVGEFLTEDERESLCLRLTEVIRSQAKDF